MRGVSLRDLEQGGTTLADKGFEIVVAVVEQFGALVVRERQGTALVHREAPLRFRCTIDTHLLPNLFVKVHQHPPDALDRVQLRRVPGQQVQHPACYPCASTSSRSSG